MAYGQLPFGNARACSVRRRQRLGRPSGRLQEYRAKGLVGTHVRQGLDCAKLAENYGGAGLSHEETKILREEMDRLGCRNPLDSFGLETLGPTLMRYGTEEQKIQHLPKMAAGQIHWCQGYSERAPALTSRRWRLGQRTRATTFL